MLLFQLMHPTRGEVLHKVGILFGGAHAGELVIGKM